MRRTSLLTIISLILLFTNISSSQTKKRSRSARDVCYEALSRHDMDRCDYRIFQEAEKKLNQNYKRLLSELGESQKSNLEQAQQKWLEFRDANCSLASDFVYRQCMTRMTRERTNELRNYNSRFMNRHSSL
jgi:uncharacterized protein YecT (DUF1311 family)